MRQITDFVAYDTIGIPAATQLTTQDFFTNASKPKQYRNLTLPGASNVKYMFTHATVRHNLVTRLLGAVADPTAPVALGLAQVIEESTFLRFQKFGTEYPLIPLSSLSPYTYAREGTGIVCRPKQVQVYQFEDMVQHSGDEQVTYQLVFPEGFQSASAALGFPLPNLLTADGFFVKLQLKGKVDRPANG